MPNTRVPLPPLVSAEAGVYIDFEANVDSPPSLLGVLSVVDGIKVFEQHVIDPALHPAAAAWSPDISGRGHCVVATPESAIERVAQLASNRRVFAYAASHERELISQIAGGAPLLVDDVLPWARRWKRHQGAVFERIPGRPVNTLRRMAELAGIEYPPFLGNRRVGANLSRIRQQLMARNGVWEDVSPGARRAWARVLQKNEWDCVTTRQLLIRIIDDLT